MTDFSRTDGITSDALVLFMQCLISIFSIFFYSLLLLLYLTITAFTTVFCLRIIIQFDLFCSMLVLIFCFLKKMCTAIKAARTTVQWEWRWSQHSQALAPLNFLISLLHNTTSDWFLFISFGWNLFTACRNSWELLLIDPPLLCPLISQLCCRTAVLQKLSLSQFTAKPQVSFSSAFKQSLIVRAAKLAKIEL